MPEISTPEDSTTPPSTTEIVAAEHAGATQGDRDTTAEILTSALDALKLSTQIAGDRLNAIFNPETRKYEPRAEMIALHGIVNANLSATLRLRRALRQVQELPAHD